MSRELSLRAVEGDVEDAGTQVGERGGFDEGHKR